MKTLMQDIGGQPLDAFEICRSCDDYQQSKILVTQSLVKLVITLFK
jgi:hypothetical protein